MKVNQPPRPVRKRPKLKHPRIALSEWIKTQPGSTRRGIWRGHFVLPDYIIQGA